MGHVLGSAQPFPPAFHNIHVQLGALPVGGGPPLPLGSDRVSPHGRQVKPRTSHPTPLTSAFFAAFSAPLPRTWTPRLTCDLLSSPFADECVSHSSSSTGDFASTACTKSTPTPLATRLSTCASRDSLLLPPTAVCRVTLPLQVPMPITVQPTVRLQHVSSLFSEVHPAECQRLTVVIRALRAAAVGRSECRWTPHAGAAGVRGAAEWRRCGSSSRAAQGEVC